MYEFDRIKLGVPFSAKEVAKQLARDAGGVLDWNGEERSWYWVARKGISFPQTLNPYLPDGSANYIHALEIPFKEKEWAREKGARWDNEEKIAWVQGNIPDELKMFAPKAYSWDWWKEYKKNNIVPPPYVPTQPWKARPHQTEASKAIAKAYSSKAPGFLLADDTGLGKTMSVWDFVLQHTRIKTVLIICPSAVQAHWRQTLLSAGDGGKYALILNYDKLGRLFSVNPGQAVKSRKGVAKFGVAPAFDLIIVDESHKIKNPTAARSKLALKLIAKSSFVLWLSATAGQTPLELSYLAPLLAIKTGDKVSSMKEFEKWCKAQGLGITRGAFGKWEWDENPEDSARVEAWLFQSGNGYPALGMRRLPTDIAGWPEMERQLYPVELSPEETFAYNLAWQEFKQNQGVPTNKIVFNKPSGKEQVMALTEQLRFRQKSSHIRVPITIQKIKDYLEAGKQVAVSVAFHETLNAIQEVLVKDGIKVSVSHGKLNDNDKEAGRLAFQREETQVCLFTQEEGISLHAGEHGKTPRVLLVHDLRWSAIQMHQIEGRCHRDGQFAPCIWMYAEGTIEEQIAQVVARRVVAMASLLGDPDSGLVAELTQLLNAVK